MADMFFYKVFQSPSVFWKSETGFPSPGAAAEGAAESIVKKLMNHSLRLIESVDAGSCDTEFFVRLKDGVRLRVVLSEADRESVSPTVLSLAPTPSPNNAVAEEMVTGAAASAAAQLTPTSTVKQAAITAAMEAARGDEFFRGLFHGLRHYCVEVD